MPPGWRLTTRMACSWAISQASATRSGFNADTVEGLRAAFHEAVEDYLETCAKAGKEPQRGYSGQVMFRLTPDLHRRAAQAAEVSGKSLNQWAAEVIDRAAG